MSNTIIDQSARLNAIDPSRSFIVRAPAGSGKTELLTQRFLQLLAYVEKNPEEIIAITFTRKAAAEMRQRIITALELAEHELPEKPHQQLTWKLAKKALKRDKHSHWQLLKNPNRLRILTIDALSAYLVKQMPLNAALGPQLNITDNPLPYYREAAEKVLLHHPLNTLLLHLDNRVYLLESLFIEILSKREQWLPYIAGYQNYASALRKKMENALKNVVRELLQVANASITSDIRHQLIPLANTAGHYCQQNHPENPIAHCYPLTTLSDSLDNLPIWIGIAHLLLTQKGEWRKNVTKHQGFPAKSELKTKMITLLDSLATQNSLKTHLYNIMNCPPCTYKNQQWEIIEILMTALPLLAAQLDLIFMRENVIDFIGLNLAALRALGDNENPTDLALHLDYRINHFLIDEFQDTSTIQFNLIEKLIAGWSPNDGRSIFLVGDPMQSIYRFRNAEVSLFLRAEQQGIGSIPLENLTLQQNFRSYQRIVDWNNQNFQTIFPEKSNIAIGATSYSPAYPSNQAEGTVQWHPAVNDDGTSEAKQVVAQIKILQNNPNDTIAIIVRSRTHLHQMIEQLHKDNITFQGIDLEPLTDLIEIQDIHSLTRALLHRADRIAWFSILRAPYCGLLLKDITMIAETAQQKSVWAILKKYEMLNISEEAKQRLQKIIPPLYNAIEHIGRYPFSHILRKLWWSLDGPATLTETKQASNIENYFQLIEKLTLLQPLPTINDIETHLNVLYAKPSADINTSLQIMTIHKAKGLEFDHVILPGLHRKAPHDTHQILKWLERPNLFGNNDLILAPIKSTDQTNDPIYRYLQSIEKNKSNYECARLLYVATTRAKKSLHLFANIIKEDNEIKSPSKGTFLNLLWPHAKQHFINQVQDGNALSTTHTIEPTPSKTFLHRFTQRSLQLKTTPTIQWIARTKPINITLQNSTSRHVGTIIHQALETLALTGTTKEKQWLIQLKQCGVAESEIPTCINTIQQAIQNTQADPKGQWILDSKHQQAHCELPLTFIEEGEIKQIIIDRTFIENGIRWIIDYKTGTLGPEELKQYEQQLITYASVFKQLEPYPIRVALYFPLTNKWIEYENLC